PRVAAPLAAMFVASVAAEAALLPVSAAIFSRVTFAGLALNFLAIPLMAVAQIAGMVIVPLFVASERLASAVGWLPSFGAEGLVRPADLWSYTPFVTWRVAPPNLLASALYYLAGLSGWYLWRRRVHVTGSGESRAAAYASRGAALLALLSALWIVAEPWTTMNAGGDG